MVPMLSITLTSATARDPWPDDSRENQAVPMRVCPRAFSLASWRLHPSSARQHTSWMRSRSSGSDRPSASSAPPRRPSSPRSGRPTPRIRRAKIRSPPRSSLPEGRRPWPRPWLSRSFPSCSAARRLIPSSTPPSEPVRRRAPRNRR